MTYGVARTRLWLGSISRLIDKVNVISCLHCFVHNMKTATVPQQHAALLFIFRAKIPTVGIYCNACVGFRVALSVAKRLTDGQRGPSQWSCVLSRLWLPGMDPTTIVAEDRMHM